MGSTKKAKPQTKRIVSVLLHAHLPYGMRADLETSLEQAWLCEAITGCYLPLLKMLQGFSARQHAPWLTVSLSPTLLELWAHPQFKERYRQHLENGIAIIEHEMGNAQHPLERRLLAHKLKAQWDNAAQQFEQLQGNLAKAFAAEAERGCIEIITTAATHAFLPGHQANNTYRRFQIENGIETFKEHTGIIPKGFWIPECAYFPGLEEELALYGIEYFALEELGLTAAQPRASQRQPLACPNGLLAFGRDATLSKKVWNARIGYPGKANYREFHHDGIHDVANSTCGSFALPNGGRLPFGLKYWRVTGSPEKDWYNAQLANQQTEADAEDFVATLSQTKEGLVFLPFDAELFGHWWHEGPQWLEKVLLAADQLPGTRIESAGSASAHFVNPPIGQPAASTWGRNADYSFWINHDTDWIYPLLREATVKLQTLQQTFGVPTSQTPEHRTLRQAARELLLAGASDWPFMIRAGATADYAMQRLRDHIGRFEFLCHTLETDSINNRDLRLLESLNTAFPNISLKAFEKAS